MQGKLRVTRVGSTVKSYYWTIAADGGASWTEFGSATGMSTHPWSLILYTGTLDPASESATFAKMAIGSASVP